MIYGVDGGLQFFLQFRALEAGAERLPLAVEMPISLVAQVMIGFCPWCGKRLERYYRKQVERLPVLAMPI